MREIRDRERDDNGGATKKREGASWKKWESSLFIELRNDEVADLEYRKVIAGDWMVAGDRQPMCISFIYLLTILLFLFVLVVERKNLSW